MLFGKVRVGAQGRRANAAKCLPRSAAMTMYTAPTTHHLQLTVGQPGTELQFVWNKSSIKTAIAHHGTSMSFLYLKFARWLLPMLFSHDSSQPMQFVRTNPSNALTLCRKRPKPLPPPTLAASTRLSTSHSPSTSSSGSCAPSSSAHPSRAAPFSSTSSSPPHNCSLICNLSGSRDPRFSRMAPSSAPAKIWMRPG